MPIQLFTDVGPLANNVYVVYDEPSNAALLVDPAMQSEPVWDFIQERGLRLEHIVNTHGHFDHAANNAYFKERAPDACLMYHPDDQSIIDNLVSTGQRFGLRATPSPPADAHLQHGLTIAVGAIGITVAHTPGHTPGGCTLLLGGVAITGDTLFQNSVGRCDLPGGSMSRLLDSIRTRLLVLPDETLVCPGHGATSDIGAEKEHNPFLNEATLRKMGLL